MSYIQRHLIPLDVRYQAGWTTAEIPGAVPASVEFTGYFDNAEPEHPDWPQPFCIRWNPEDRAYTEEDAVAMVGKLITMHLDGMSSVHLAGTVAEATVEDGGRALILRGQMEPVVTA